MSDFRSSFNIWWWPFKNETVIVVKSAWLLYIEVLVYGMYDISKRIHGNLWTDLFYKMYVALVCIDLYYKWYSFLTSISLVLFLSKHLIAFVFSLLLFVWVLASVSPYSIHFILAEIILQWDRGKIIRVSTKVGTSCFIDDCNAVEFALHTVMT